ncbi:MAG: exodeoxyribonuclease VII large subunit [Bacteroidetes bacterium]|nr:MAG: exodeoxyribonuclease VII large subunit [Bacteroidota bacterium]REK07546.1 MAG: exodeoxyribonuclease VII large subunit [Bacteroidota bacterium]REK47842.1 MAG: exodeoxyribonuclease VII large subunit [Bacteroidota bacterium]
MPEIVKNKTIFSLLEVARSIKKTIEDRYKSTYWVKAEINKLNYYKHSGHCYPELVEKNNGKVIAQMRASLWSNDYKRIDEIFIKTLKEPLKDGIKVLMLVKITFEPEYGLSLRIIDIDPSYTLGDLEKEKQETIQQLKAEGIFDRNKQARLALLPQRIAIISVETSKGYADFSKVIDSNPWGYKFFHMLFPALLQGDKAVQSIAGQLKKIKNVRHHFDVVAIIRGGGGDVGLSCYNHYNLAKEIAMFPIPVFTGIGHATNETVTEMISHTNAITPTKLAEFLIQKFHNFSVPVQDAERKLIERSQRMISETNDRLLSEVKYFRSVTENALMYNRNTVTNSGRSLIQNSRHIFKSNREYLNELKLDLNKFASRTFHDRNQAIIQFAIAMRKDVRSGLQQAGMLITQAGEKLASQSVLMQKKELQELNIIEKNIANMSPDNVLKRGYSITLLNGKVVKSASEVTHGDLIHSKLHEGEIISTVNKTTK